MKIISVNLAELPESYLKLFRKCSERPCFYRSEYIRAVIRDYVIKESTYSEKEKTESEDNICDKHK